MVQPGVCNVKGVKEIVGAQFLGKAVAGVRGASGVERAVDMVEMVGRRGSSL